MTEEHPMVGKRVRLTHTEDHDSDLPRGAMGTIVLVDSNGTRHVDWDNGSKLGLIPGLDKWEIIGEDGEVVQGASDILTLRQAMVKLAYFLQVINLQYMGILNLYETYSRDNENDSIDEHVDISSLVTMSVDDLIYKVGEVIDKLRAEYPEIPELEAYVTIMPAARLSVCESLVNFCPHCGSNEINRPEVDDIYIPPQSMHPVACTHCASMFGIVCEC